MDFSAFGGGSAVSASNNNGTWTASYTITAGNVDGTNKHVSVTAMDNAGNTTTTDSTNATVDNIAPVVTPPAAITVNATGLFTKVDVGSGSAVDPNHGNLSVTNDASTFFSTGSHTITWSATDAAGNKTTATQEVDVIPMVNLSKDQVTAEGATVSFKVILNGKPVHYPVVVPYTLSGTANTDGTDYDFTPGSVTINSPDLSATVTGHILVDQESEGAETLVVTLGQPQNAIVGSKSTHTMTIMDQNVAPVVSLSADQGSGETRIIEQGSGNVVVTANVVDPNPGDTQTYDWSRTDNSLVDLDTANNTFTFSPNTVGIFKLEVTVTDSGGLTDTRKLTINVVPSLPTLTSQDSNGDGVSDNVEGHGDSDGDGIPNYLDNKNLQPNTLQEQSLNSRQFLLETEPGLSLSIGSVAFNSGNSDSSVSINDILQHGNSNTGAQADTGHDYNGGIFDFQMTQLPVVGQVSNIVIPQFAAIPANAIYRKLTSGSWFQFVEDSNNKLWSAPGSEGFCPPPGDAAYVPGLVEGSWCVQLSIQDGGPNDSDGVADGNVSDPGGVTQAVSKSASVSGGGGSTDWLFLAMLGLLLIGGGKKTQLRIMLSIMLLLSSFGTRAAEPKPFYVEGNLGLADSNWDQQSFISDLKKVTSSESLTNVNDMRFTWQLMGGYRIKHWLAAEAGYVDWGKIDTQLQTVSTTPDALRNLLHDHYPHSGKGLYAGLRLSYFMPQGTELYYRAGLWHWRSSYDIDISNEHLYVVKKGMDVLQGAGINMPLNTSWSVGMGLQWVYLAGQGQTQIGIQSAYHF
jgi:hypothetical protein